MLFFVKRGKNVLCAPLHVGNPFYSLYQFECTSLATKSPPARPPPHVLLAFTNGMLFIEHRSCGEKKPRSFGVTQNCSQREMKIQFGHRRREHWIKKSCVCFPFDAVILDVKKGKGGDLGVVGSGGAA